MHSEDDRPGSGDSRARAEQLFVEYEARIRAYVAFRVRNHADVEDLVGEVFRRVVGSAAPDESAIRRAWLFRIAHNLVVDHYKRRRFPNLPDFGIDRPDDAPALPDLVVRTERLRAIDQSMRRLPGRQRAAVYLRYYEELEYAEVAEILGVPQVTVRSLVHRGLKRLATDLRGWEAP